jgi:hypothetical protein
MGWKPETQHAYDLSSLSSQPPGELEVLGLDGDSLSVDGAQVRVLEERDEVGLRGFPEGHDGAEQAREKRARSSSAWALSRSIYVHEKVKRTKIGIEGRS